jgi:hypothetical protein
MAYFRVHGARDAADDSSRVHGVNRGQSGRRAEIAVRMEVFQVQATRAPNSFRAVTCLAT